MIINIDNFSRKKILISIDGKSHFIDEIVEKLKEEYEITLDEWDNKNCDLRIKYLGEYDIIFCEWCGNNAIWYSNNKKQNQKLIIRLHRWELYAIHFFKTNWKNVDKIIFISPYIQEQAIIRYSEYYNLNKDNFDEKYYIENNDEFFNKNEIITDGWVHFNDYIKRTFGKIPNFKCITNPNFIDYEFKNKTVLINNYIKKSIFINNDKYSDSKYNIGLIGFVPKLKRADIAIEILNYLVKYDKNYKLFMIGINLKDIPWLSKNKLEINYYNNINKLIHKYGLEKNVIFENFNKDINLWFKNIGYILSTSDIEGCHHSLAEGMGCGTIPLLFGNALKKYKLDLIYPKEFCFYENNIKNLCNKIIELNTNDELRFNVSSRCNDFAIDKFNFNDVYNYLKKTFN